MTTNEIQLIEKFGDKTVAAIQQVATKLGQSVDHFYPIIVKQEVVQGYAFLFSAYIPLIVAAIIIVYYTKFKKIDWDESISLGQVLFILSAVAMIGVGTIALVGTAEAINHIVNPEYYALTDILKMIK